MTEQEKFNNALKNATDVVCPKCKNEAFETIVLIKKISAIMSPNGEESVVPMPAYRCAECHYILQNEDIMVTPKKEESPLKIIK